MSALLVALQFALIGLIVARLDPSAIGVPFAILLGASAAVGAWAFLTIRPGNFNIRPEPKVGGRLVTHGPYRWVRHPMYLAVLLFCAAFALGSNWEQWALWVLLAGVLFLKVRREERLMTLAHPGYADYRARTRAILPFVL